MPSPARWWSNHACCDEVSETIVRCVDGRQSGDGATSIGDDHFFTGLDAIDVLAETILQIADPHLGPGSSYIHDSSVATSTIRSTDRFGGRCAPNLSEPVGHDPVRASVEPVVALEGDTDHLVAKTQREQDLGRRGQQRHDPHPGSLRARPDDRPRAQAGARPVLVNEASCRDAP